MDIIKKKKRGRPVGSKSSNNATKLLPSVRVTQVQLDKYQEASKREGVSFSAWVRDKLDSASKN